ncbi:hypothetical protein ACFW04_005369 [Cataglyphis niger]
MKKTYLIILLTICIYNVFLVTNSDEQCFHFTWLRSERDCTMYNKNYSNIPCIDPILNDTILDTTDLWNKIKNQSIEHAEDYLTPMKSCVCIKYTYVYNREVINASYFCGRVIEDQAITITSGCYVTYTEGYAIEVCACKSEAGRIPCNSTIRNTYSILITFIAILLYIKFIYI